MVIKIKAENIKTSKILKFKLFDVLRNVRVSDVSYLGEFIANMIRKRTRLGYGVKEQGAQREKLKQLEGRPRPYKSTIYQRELAKRKGELSAETTPTKSNLTMTGRMLDAIKWTALRLSGKVFVENSSRPDSSSTNRQIAKYNEDKGREFFNLSDSEIRQLKREAVKIIKESLKR